MLPCASYSATMASYSITEAAAVLQELEDKILKLLKDAKGNILDDEVLINTLNNSKLTAGMIQNRVREAEETEDSINQVNSLPLACIPSFSVILWPFCRSHEV